MKKLTLGILGNDYDLTTKFMEEIVLNTNANTDQEHIKMNIIINNKLLTKSNLEILEMIKKLEMIDTTHLVLAFNDKTIQNFIKDNTNLIILNQEFNLNDKNLLNKIFKLHEERL